MRKIATILLICTLLLAGCEGIPLPSQPAPVTTPTITATETATPAASPSPAVTATPTQSATPAATPTADATADFKALLPTAEGYRWRYFGTAEYSHTMKLVTMRQSGENTIYTAEGNVADMSGGASGKDFSTKITYTAAPGSLRVQSTGAMLMDNVFPNLELLRAPLRSGATWAQTAVSSDGKKHTLNCIIESVGETDGHKSYTVLYSDSAGPYYEKRTITQGMGVTAFERLLSLTDQSDVISYHLADSDAALPAELLEPWLPPLGKQYRYAGLAEYGHVGSLAKRQAGKSQIIYRYTGTFTDGIGDNAKFVMDYFADLARGTVTEKVVSNARGAAEVNSKLHNCVMLLFPLEQGKTWRFDAKLNGKKAGVKAEITAMDAEKGSVTVRYTAKATGYYNNTYIEERTFQKGLGMTRFSCLMPGDLGISDADSKDPDKVKQAIENHMFGYAMTGAVK